MGIDLVDVGPNVHGRLPGVAPIAGAEDSADMDIEIDRSVAVLRHRAHIGRAAPRSVPGVSTRSLVKALHGLQRIVVEVIQPGS